MNARTSLWPRFARRVRHERPGFLLYGAAVTAARDPYLYSVLGVPDTLDGRFDMIGLHAWLVIHRLRFLPEPGPALAQAVFDAMFSDMDIALREMGVGDLSVGKRVRAMWEAFHGRARAYEDALTETEPDGLPDVLIRNVWRGATPPDGAAAALARLTRSQHGSLTHQDPALLFAGQAQFLPATEAAK
ncbi:MAG TPA: ubiquinol-cytochrome C chaperone family protein [Acetobacteraceae bacterium]|jgi:cytochrome b pre-mRNA-processing protein 3|nr:ubiquinol-cytochrome C chaperone family protein [Acetobacteraceae bacterium]